MSALAASGRTLAFTTGHAVTSSSDDDSHDPIQSDDEQAGHSSLYWAAVGAAAGVAVVALAAGTYWMFLRPSAPAPATVVVESPRPRPTAPEPATPAPAPSAPTVAPPPPARRPRAASTEPAPTAAPAPAPDRGTLDVQTDVPGASVFVDRVFQGQAPLTVPDLAPGSHTVNVSAEGYEGIVRNVDIAAGPNTLAVSFKEVTLDAAIPVVHRHRMGSCQGQLVATIQGLRYETSNKDDGFTVGFGQLGRFEVDYLKKTLRVERRGGRGYDFTDKQPTADALFVFHRDVDKARRRLAGASQP
jgi:hypothetical protein